MFLMVFIENFTTSAQSPVSLYDWSKDIIIPLIGAIAVPLFIWGLTRHYGADKAEERKEKKELRDNLNLLSSVLSTSIVPLLGLKDIYVKIQQSLQKPLEQYSEDDLSAISKAFYTKFSILDIIEPSKYSVCINAYDNFVVDLITIIQSSHILNELVLHRNDLLKDIGNCEDLNAKNLRFLDFIKEEYSNIENNIMLVNKLLLDTKNFIDEIKKLETKITDLKLDTVGYPEHVPAEFKKAKQELAEYNKKISEDKIND